MIRRALRFRTNRTSARRAVIALGMACSLLTSPRDSIAGKLDTWKQDTAAAFSKGHKERVVVSDAGRVRLGRAVLATEGIDAAHVWDLVRTPKGETYAATGNEGKVYRREGAGPWTVVYDASDTQVLSLAVLPDGHVFAGTGPSGEVVALTAPKQAATRPDPGVQYVWDLAADGAGNLYAATGPTGQLWKRDPDGKWSLLLDSKRAHLLCVTVGPDGSVFAGSDGEGLIYRIAPGGKVSVIYDAPQSEIRTLLVAPDGALIAGTAAESGGAGSGPTRGLTDFAPDESPAAPEPGPQRVQTAAQAKSQTPRRPSETSSGGTAAPRPITPGDNAVYRIDTDGAARELFRARVLIYALAWQDDRLLVGTGPEGLLYEVRDMGRESAPIARLDHGQILALTAGADGEVLIGAGEPGGVLRLAKGHAADGSLTSDVLDSKLISRFGAIQWAASRPESTTLTIQLRTGNVSEPDETWSAWSAPLTEPGARAEVPPGRFGQYRVNFKAGESQETPELRTIAVRYQTMNLAPEIARIDVPDLSEGDGAARQSRLNLKWEASDPNGDDLSYTLDMRKEGWPDWVRLTEHPLTDKTFGWDISAVPAGVYRIRVTASDRPGNPPEDAFERELTSETFVVDHQAPAVAVSAKGKGKGATVALKDELTRIVKAAYALDGGDWVPVFPADGLFDAREESITIDLPELASGTHVLVIRATDAAGNVGSGDAILSTP